MGKHFLWDPVEDNIIEEFDDVGNTIADYTTEPYLYGDLISQHRNGQSSFYHYDGQGSTTSLTDSVATVTDAYAYSAFGVVTSHTGSTVNPFQYIGQKQYYRDLETSECYVRRRFLSTTRGSWLSPDPLGIAAGDLNLLRYIENLPTSAIDPSGQEWQRSWYDRWHPKFFGDRPNPRLGWEPIKLPPGASMSPGSGIVGYHRLRRPPGARLDIFGVRQENFSERQCDKDVKMFWDFFIDDGNGNGAPCDGYIVQKHRFFCHGGPCGKASCDRLYPVSTKSPPYWEAWFVKKGEFTSREGGSGYTDGSEIQTTKGFCGTFRLVGTVKFFCINTTKDLGRQGKPNAGSGWTIGMVYTDPSNMCPTIRTGPIPTTGNEPAWWNDPSVGGVRTRRLSVDFKCCGCKDDYVEPEADPPCCM